MIPKGHPEPQLGLCSSSSSQEESSPGRAESSLGRAESSPGRAVCLLGSPHQTPTSPLLLELGGRRCSLQPPSPRPSCLRYLLVQPEAQCHPLAALLLAALGAVQVPAELGQRDAGLPVGVEHVGWGQHDEGVCHRAWHREAGGDRSEFPGSSRFFPPPFLFCLAPQAAPKNRESTKLLLPSSPPCPRQPLLPVPGSGEQPGAGRQPGEERGGSRRPPQQQAASSCLLQ